jgi:hypothetical protein
VIGHFDTEFFHRYFLSKLKSVHVWVLRTKHVSHMESVAWSCASVWLLILHTVRKGNKDGLCISEVIKSYSPTYIQEDATLHCVLYLEIDLHVSGVTSTHYQERIQLYLQHLVFVTPLLLPATTATGSNTSTNARCCRYSYLCSWWWVMLPPETCRAVSSYNKLCNVALDVY